MKGRLYGSLTSPYARITRLARLRADTAEFVSFGVADPYSDTFRATNPLGKVPALIIDDGPSFFETSLIVRALNEFGDGSLVPLDTGKRLEAEADLALALGILDLGVAFLLEQRRPAGEQSASWSERRLKGIRAALPAFDAAAERQARAAQAEERLGAAGLAIVATADWLSFRLSEQIAWREACPAAAGLAADYLGEEDLAATDPRLA
ncbi:MAG: glutathione S-transferase N-terminal domain-containing protein [Pseudomonadota bacterium]